MTDDSQTIEISDPTQLLAAPLVSVLMITYNHVEYLAEAIEGVLGQECDFPFELVIGEDCSTDGTRNVATEYQKRFPEIIRLVYAERNVGMTANSWRLFACARGKFLAYCEGDDFWCSPNKLSQQVALMASDERIGVVHTDWTRAVLRDGTWVFALRKSVHRRVPDHLLQGDLFATWHFPKILRTCTVMVRRSVVQALHDTILADSDYLFGDSVYSAFVTSRWRVGYLSEVTAVYRVSPNSALRSGAASRVAFYRSALLFDADARRFFAERAHCMDGYRWDSIAGLFVWGIRARDGRAVAQACREMWEHFGPVRFFAVGCKTIKLRVPTWRRQHRKVPSRLSGQDVQRATRRAPWTG